MKRILFFTAILMLVIATVLPVQAQGFVSGTTGFYKMTIEDFGGKGPRLVLDSCYVVSTNSYYSPAFSLAGLLESSFDTNYAGQAGKCISIGYAIDTVDAAAGSETADITLILQGSFTGQDNWATAATVFSTTGVTAITWTTMTLKGAQYPYYRWKATGITTNTYSRVFIGLYAFRKW